mmetsp:Transcript_11340/g.28597  ORF Transcript_11340/g.28597 Transcript_11340/m.28597 type:complete len:225 (-) Transcript_11340:78-752(-)|eukprot:CAMPEP_0177631530 /NCGR_PEP_ID=MMETSP0447-20121125/1799_1 /TAXON_ID=0 /ORGANISM="Stygamoeba regulata, Strain BSH-02190019" /LENGTH=224 /DNA_ID=CAMNT_0019133021 /DNA_START=31 /DNA_END=705 /DNA_ORIENTATION=+
MNVTKYGVKSLWALQSRRSTVSSDKRLLFLGLGNQFYPRIRCSVGLHALNCVADHIGLEWREEREYGVTVAENEDVILAKPINYFANGNGHAAAALLRAYSVAPRELTVVHHSMDFDIGQYKRLSSTVPEPENEHLNFVCESLHQEEFKRIAIGICPEEPFDMLMLPHLAKDMVEIDLKERHLLNMFSVSQDDLIRKVTDRLTEEILEAIAEEAGKDISETTRL